MKIIFFLNSLNQQRCYKRIREFAANGYDTEAYGFCRDGKTVPMTDNMHITPLATLHDNTPYRQRLTIMRKSMKNILNQYKNNRQIIFYYFQLDIAIAATSITKHTYIYEQSDLSQAYIKNAIIRNTLNIIDRHIIKHSAITVFTSAGFAHFHFPNNIPDNIIIIPNKLDPKITSFPYSPQPIDFQHIRFSYIGVIRHQATYNFAKVITQHFPQHEIHLYGIIRPEWGHDILNNKPDNLFIHTTFTNPDDLPEIYQNTDILLSPSDNNNLNGIYSETNKLYEGIYFRKPIIANTGTHTAQIIKQQGIGYELDFNSQEAIRQFISNITPDQIQNIITNLNNIPQTEALNNNPELFRKIQQLDNQLNKL